MNKVELDGRLTKDPEVNDRSGTPVCDMRLAVNGPGNTPPLFIDVVAFNDLAASARRASEGLPGRGPRRAALLGVGVQGLCRGPRRRSAPGTR